MVASDVFQKILEALARLWMMLKSNEHIQCLGGIVVLLLLLSIISDLMAFRRMSLLSGVQCLRLAEEESSDGGT
jgi:hypothetical protein